MRVRLISLLAIVCVVAGCAHHRQVTWKLTNAESMRDTVTANVPNGASIDDAIAFMESEGFKCTVEMDSSFRAIRHWADDGPKYNHLDFVRCIRKQTAGHILMQRVWSVAMVLDKNEKVSDVLIAVYEDGP